MLALPSWVERQHGAVRLPQKGTNPRLLPGVRASRLMPQTALPELIQNMRAMAARYRKWADEASSENQAEEFCRLADSSEATAFELEGLLRRKEAS